MAGRRTTDPGRVAAPAQRPGRTGHAGLRPLHARVLSLQRSHGNRAVARAVELGALDRRFIQEDVEEIVSLLREQVLDSDEEARIVAIVRRYSDVDARHNAAGRDGTVNLDAFLLALKQRVFTRRTARSGWVETWVNAYDTIWHELEGGNLEEFKAIVAKSAKQATKGALSGPSENLWATLGKKEALGVWGMLKGMGLTLAGVADGAIWLAWKQSGEPLGRVLERYGVKDAAKAPQLTPYLTKNYDEVAKLMATQMGIDPDDDAYATGEFGGKVVGTLTLAGAGTAGGWSGTGAKTIMPVAMKVLGLAGALKGIEDSAQNIANRIEELQKRTPPPSFAQMLVDSRIHVELLSILANAVGAAGGAGDAAPTFAKALAKAGIAVDVLAVAPQIAKFTVDLTDPELAKDPKAREAALRDDVAAIVGAILSTIGTKHYEAGEKAKADKAAAKQAQNDAFDARYNPKTTLPKGAEGMGEFMPHELGGHPDDPALELGPAYDHSKIKDPQAHAKLQQLVHSTLTADGPNSLVKVVPASYDPMTAVKGYVTQRKFLVGRTPEQLAAMLGVKSLENGVTVYRVNLADVTPEMLQLRGYTQSPGGRDRSLHTAAALKNYPVGQGAPQWDLPTAVGAKHIVTLGKGQRFGVTVKATP
jgi:hypothetical protein